MFANITGLNMHFTGCSYLIDVGGTREDYQKGKCRTLLYLLSKFRSSEAIDARDKVFALLGLVTGISGLGDLYLVPDYSSTTTEVYSHVAKALIYSSRTLYCLKDVRSARVPSLERTLGEDFPSWVPDWSDSESTPCSLGDSVPQSFSATGNSIHVPQLPELRGTLTVRGHIIDEVLQMGTPYSTDRKAFLSQITSWKSLVTHQT